MTITELQINRITIALEELAKITMQTQEQTIKTVIIAKALHNREFSEWGEVPSWSSFKSKTVYRILKDLQTHSMIEGKKNNWKLTEKGLKIGKILINRERHETELREENPIIDDLIERTNVLDLSVSYENHFHLNIIFPDQHHGFRDAYDEFRSLSLDLIEKKLGFALALFYGLITNKLNEFAEKSTFFMLDAVGDSTKEEIIEELLKNEEFKKIFGKEIDGLKEKMKKFEKLGKDNYERLCETCKLRVKRFE